MRKSLFVLLLFVTIKLFPQQIEQPPVQQNQPYNPNFSLSKYQKMEKHAKTAIIVGSILTAGGAALLGGGLYGISNANNSLSYLAPVAFGAMMGIAGVHILVPALFKYYYATKKLNTANVSIAVTPVSFRIAYTF
jgi:hypothetical protein